MTRIVVTHAVKDVEQWLACRAKTVAAFAPYATDIFFYTIPEGSNNVAISLNVHDMAGMMAATETPEHKAMTEEAGVIHPPHAMYFEATD
jgi:hypothetical protein